ncbi:MAG: hypothetical protein H3Z50_07880 [archaeon]|nr:hypothetical protein [archaeon]MCP8305934.1 hypothetical protein [archaeon]
MKNLSRADVNCHPAVMVSFSKKDSFYDLVERIKEIDSQIVSKIEIEELILYNRVAERIKKYGLKPFISHHPQRVLKELT